MAPNHGFVVEHDGVMEPRSRTYQYRKVMKPMLERKRRARINRCLDELKELMTSTFQAEGENVAKLEKADILELTVRHLHTLRRQNQIAIRTDVSYIDRFRAGFKHCAVEVSTFLGGGQEVRETTAHLIGHLEGCIRRLDTVQTSQTPTQTPTLTNTPPTNTPTTVLETKLPLQLLQNRIVMTNQTTMPPPMPPRKRFNTVTDINFHSTPPISPNIDVEGFPVWRPW